MQKAPEKPEVEEEEVPVPTGRSKKKIILMAVAVLVALSVIGGTTILLLKKPSTSKVKEHKEEPAKPPVFLALETFVVNVQSEGGDKYLQVQLTLQVADEAQVALIKTNMPQVKSRLLMLLSSKEAAELLTPDGKKKLITEIIEQVNIPFVARGAPQKVSGVFFTSFVVQ